MLLRALLIIVLTVCPVFADEVAQTADEASLMLQSARQKLQSARSARSEIKALVEAIRAYEVAMIAMQGGLREIRNATRSAEARFNDRRARVEKALVAIQAIERASNVKRSWHPGGALASARAGMTMADLLPALNGEAEALKAELSGLATLTALQEAAEANMVDAGIDMRKGISDLQQAMAEKSAQAPLAADKRRRLEELARNAAELGDLADGLAAIAPVDLEDVRDPPIPGTLQWPVQGDILRKFNETDAAGIERAGVIVAAPPQSLLLSPSDAEISYSGPFLDQGSVIIMELSGEYLLVLGGLGQSFVTTGDKVEKGTPLGLLGGVHTSDEEFLIRFRDANSAFRKESLYIELRENGIAVDPTAWFEPVG